MATDTRLIAVPDVGQYTLAEVTGPAGSEEIQTVNGHRALNPRALGDAVPIPLDGDRWPSYAANHWLEAEPRDLGKVVIMPMDNGYLIGRLTDGNGRLKVTDLRDPHASWEVEPGDPRIKLVPTRIETSEVEALAPGYQREQAHARTRSYGQEFG